MHYDQSSANWKRQIAECPDQNPIYTTSAAYDVRSLSKQVSQWDDQLAVAASPFVELTSLAAHRVTQQAPEALEASTSTATDVEKMEGWNKGLAADTSRVHGHDSQLAAYEVIQTGYEKLENKVESKAEVVKEVKPPGPKPQQTPLGRMMNASIMAALGQDHCFRPCAPMIRDNSFQPKVGDPYRVAVGGHSHYCKFRSADTTYWKHIVRPPLTPWLRNNNHEYDDMESVRPYGWEKYEHAESTMSFMFIVKPAVTNQNEFAGILAHAVGKPSTQKVGSSGSALPSTECPGAALRRQDIEIVSLDQLQNNGSRLTVKVQTWDPQRTANRMRTLTAAQLQTCHYDTALSGEVDTIFEPSRFTSIDLCEDPTYGSVVLDGPNAGAVPAKAEQLERDDFDSTLRAECIVVGSAALFDQKTFSGALRKKMKIPTGTCKVSVQGTTPGGGDQQDSLLLAVRVSGALCTAGRLHARLKDCLNSKVGGYRVDAVQTF